MWRAFVIWMTQAFVVQSNSFWARRRGVLKPLTTGASGFAHTAVRTGSQRRSDRFVRASERNPVSSLLGCFFLCCFLCVCLSRWLSVCLCPCSLLRGLLFLPSPCFHGTSRRCPWVQESRVPVTRLQERSFRSRPSALGILSSTVNPFVGDRCCGCLHVPDRLW